MQGKNLNRINIGCYYKVNNFTQEKWKENKQLTGNEFIAKTIVTTTLLDKIAAYFDVESINTLTGFKYIAEEIRLNEGKKQFIVGGSIQTTLHSTLSRVEESIFNSAIS